MRSNQFSIKFLIPEFFHRFWWIIDPVDYLTTFARQRGDFFKSAIVPHDNPLYMVSNPQALQQIFSNDTKQFSAPGELNAVVIPVVGNHSILLLSGKRHQRERKLLMPPFHGQRLNTYGQLICRLTKQVMNQLTVGQTFVAYQVMKNITMQMILQIVFGVHEGERYQRLRQNISALLEMFSSPLKSSILFLPWLQYDLGPWSPWGSFLRRRETIDKLIYAQIAESRASDNSHRTDILSLLIDARDEEGESMTDQQLRDELITLMIAGHDTTAIAMSWALYWTHYLPEVCEKLRYELDTLDGNFNPTDIVTLPYLNAVCNETLRIHPVGVGSAPREVCEPVELLGCNLAPKTVLMPSIYLLHQRPDIYPEPKKFKPERFLNRTFSPYEFMPFGGGVRRCIGGALAMYEMKLVLATILSNYQLELAEKRPVKPKLYSVFQMPEGGVKMVMRERHQN